MKSVLSFLLAIIMVVSVIVVAPISVEAKNLDILSLSYTEGVFGDYEYQVNDEWNGEEWLGTDTTITKYNGTDSSVVIPSEINGNPVTTIGYQAFYNSSISSVTIPDSVIHIKSNAFGLCYNLTEITLPASVEYVQSRIVEGCENLERFIVLNPQFEFDSKYTVPETVTVCGYTGSTAQEYAEKYGRAFESLGDIPDNPTKPEDFEYQLLKDNTAEIISYTGTSKKIIIPPILDNHKVTSIGSFAFRNSYCIEVVIPDTVSKIGLGAFFQCDSMKKVDIPNSVTIIDEGAFCDCNKLEVIDIPNSVITINTSAFNGCESLTSVVIPPSVEYIGSQAFDICTSVTEFTILSPECVIFDSERTITYANAKLCGYAGSTTQAYAEKYNKDFIPLADYTDEATDISLIAQTNVTLNVEVIDDIEDIENVSLLLTEEKVDTIYDITLFENGEYIRPSSSVIVKIPTTNENAKVYRVELTGEITDMNAVYKDGYMVFTTNHFSQYVLTIPEDVENYKLGDVDGDGDISIIDATAIQLHIASLAILTEEEQGRGDTDKDGDVSILDATAIQMFVAKLIAEF